MKIIFKRKKFAAALLMALSLLATALGVMLFGAPAAAQAAETGYSINFEEETITIVEGYEVYTAKTEGTKIESGSSITAYIGETLYIQQTGSAERTAITIPARPQALNISVISIDYEEEKFASPPGTDTSNWEYSTDSAQTWNDVPDGMALSEMGWDGSAQKSYYFRIRATDISFAGVETTNHITVPARPAKPADPTPVKVTSDSITIVIEDRQEYRIYSVNSEPGPWSTLTAATDGNYTWEPLQPGTKYTIETRTKGGENEYYVEQFASYPADTTVTTLYIGTVDVGTEGGGTASASSASAVQGTEITLTADPNNGYHFKEWQVVSGGITITDDKFTMPAANVEIKAVFEEHTPKVIKEPTCEGWGEAGGVCTFCNAPIEAQPIDPLGHDYNGAETVVSWDGVAAPTVSRACQRAGCVHVDSVIATDVRVTTVYEATCTKEGLKECTATAFFLGGEAFPVTATAPIPALDHDYTDVTPQWEWSGFASATASFPCTREDCGYVEVITADITDKITTAATCESEGVRTYTAAATFGGNTFTDSKTEAIPMAAHTPETVPGKAATCTSTGLTSGSKCSVCGDILTAQSVIPAKGHRAETIPGKAATCTETGLTASSKCTVCGRTLQAQSVIPAKGHTPGAEATCTEAQLCTVCGETLVKAKGHTAGAHVRENENAPTCTEEGSYDEAVYCTVCEEELSRKTVTIEAAGHSPELVAGKAATCTESGMTDGEKCSVCGEVLEEQETIPALGHSVGEWTTVKEPTHSAEGEEQRICSRCGEKETQAIPALEGLSGGAIAGIAVGSTLGALLLAYGVLALLFKKGIVTGAFFVKIYPFIKL